MPSPVLPTSPFDLTRLSRRALLLGAPLALAGCTVRGRFNDDEARLDIPPRAAGLGEWEEVYGARFDNGFEIEAVDPNEIDPIWLRRVVAYDGFERPGTIIVDPAAHYLYLVRENGRAIRYGVGVGRDGFSWKGRATIARKGVWPRWTPPHEMTLRDEEAAKWAAGMPGGPANPLGARALYLYQGKVDTLYRIHGNNDPTSIGKSVSSGCIRLLNQDIVDLHARVPVGTNVLVLG